MPHRPQNDGLVDLLEIANPLNCLQVYDYQGKLLSAPNSTCFTGSELSMPMISLSSDFLAILEPATHTSVHFFHTASGQPTMLPLQIRKEEDSRKLVHDGNLAVMNIVSVSLSQTGGQVWLKAKLNGLQLQYRKQHAHIL
jgi:hypothetical protein